MGPVANFPMGIAGVLIVEQIWYFSAIERSNFSYEARHFYPVHTMILTNMKIVHQPYQFPLYMAAIDIKILNLHTDLSKLYFW